MLALGCAVVAALGTAAIGAFARPVAVALGLLDFPDEPGGRKLHSGVTPLVGGVAIMIAVAVGIAASILLMPDSGPLVLHDLVRLGLGVAAMFLIGLADDRFDLSVRARLSVATLVLLVVVVVVPDFSVAFMRLEGGGRLMLLGAWSVPFTLLCLVGLLNAINMADGKNGIVIGQALVWSAFLLVNLPSTMLPLMAAVSASLAVLLVFNMRGRLFLGDGGSYAVSAFFGLTSIYCYNHAFLGIGVDNIALLFLVPVLDTLRLVVTRIAQRRSPFAGGRDHLHHYLYGRLGWPSGLLLYLGLVGVPNFASAAFGGASAWLVVTLIGYVLLLHWTSRSLPSQRDRVEHAA